ncbi:MAG: PQQ-dependent sugar dehydrogenase [Phycisphaerales bacterium]|nr:PQQ-dependent sugar dehydrogenase [Phycisphaerales bacterium]
MQLKNVSVYAAAAIATVFMMSSSKTLAVPLTTTTLVTNLNRPVEVVAAPGDTDRLFIVEKRGVIRILDLNTNTLLPTPFLNISPTAPVAAHRRVVNISGGNDERGLLGMAFHPNYGTTNFFFFVYYIDDSGFPGDTVIARYKIGGNLNEADPNSELILRTINQPESNHNGGCVRFGSDGKLYISTGDGGGANDNHPPIGNSQNLQNLLGKILRLDIDIASPFIPADNPNIPDPNSAQPFALPEIWSFGLRNPWRFSFDRLTGDMWIGDVGQGSREEINHVPVSSVGGENYGWRCMEGNLCFISPSGAICTCGGGNLTDPVFDYASVTRCSVVGGFVYRGLEIPEENGNYFYSDFCTGEVWSFDPASPAATNVEHIDLTTTITAIGEGANGELYVCTGTSTTSSTLRRIVPTCNSPSDINADCSINLTDANILIDVLTDVDPGDPALENRCDVNDDGNIDGEDIEAWLNGI